MGDTFFDYLQHLEMLAFFSGYPLVYTIVFFIAGDKHSRTFYKKRIVSFLPFAYALSGTLFLGLQLNNLYPDYSFENIKLAFQDPYLKIWGIFSVLFWIPALNKKPVLSLVHSLFFFFLLAKDLLLYVIKETDQSLIRNEMKIYTDSLLLNSSCLLFITIFYFVFKQYRHRSTGY
jgi:succinate-acetate transporter protein